MKGRKSWRSPHPRCEQAVASRSMSGRCFRNPGPCWSRRVLAAGFSDSRRSVDAWEARVRFGGLGVWGFGFRVKGLGSGFWVLLVVWGLGVGFWGWGVGDWGLGPSTPGKQGAKDTRAAGDGTCGEGCP